MSSEYALSLIVDSGSAPSNGPEALLPEDLLTLMPKQQAGSTERPTTMDPVRKRCFRDRGCRMETWGLR